MANATTSPANEHCNRCGVSVARGSGHFVNRIPDCNGRQRGAFICADCDAEPESPARTIWIDRGLFLRQRKLLWSLQDRMEFNEKEQELVDGLVNVTDWVADNARLIAASPDLLDTCKMLLKVLTQDCDAEAFGSEISHAAAVIAAAEGR